MRIAVVHPYPVHSGALGGTTRVDALVSRLARRHEVSVLFHANPGGGDAELSSGATAGPHIDRRSFPRPIAPLWKRAAWAIDRLPYFVHYNRNPCLEAALIDLERSGPLDLVHVEFAYLEPLLAGLSQRPVRILAEQEMMSVSIERLRRIGFMRKSLYENYIPLELSRIRRFEAAAIRRFDHVYAINSSEASRMGRLTDRPVRVLPHVVDTDRFVPPKAEAEAMRLLFVGDYRHHPNREAIGWFTDRVWPTIRHAVPEAKLDVVGPGLGDVSTRRLGQRGASVPGYVQDLVARYQRATVFVNPIRSGGGMRGKVLEAFACARPVVSTTLGLEGISARPGEHCLIADREEEFGSAVIRLLRDRSVRRTQGAAARRLVEERYNRDTVLAGLERDYEAAVRARREHLSAGAVA